MGGSQLVSLVACARRWGANERVVGVAGPAEHVTAELQALYASFQRCLDLREKYMRLSRQRLEDNPANYDGQYAPNASIVVNGGATSSTEASQTFKRWGIYPPPPSPHWKERDPYSEATETTQEIADREAKRRRFNWDEVVIPGLEEEVQGRKTTRRKKFALDSNGVFQVYDAGSFLPSIPSIPMLTIMWV
jgi:AMP deaminase